MIQLSIFCKNCFRDAYIVKVISWLLPNMNQSLINISDYEIIGWCFCTFTLADKSLNLSRQRFGLYILRPSKYSQTYPDFFDLYLFILYLTPLAMSGKKNCNWSHFTLPVIK